MPPYSTQGLDKLASQLGTKGLDKKGEAIRYLLEATSSFMVFKYTLY